MLVLRSAFLALAALLATAATASAALPEIHAHRGGPFTWGKAAFAEEALPTYVAAAKAGDVLELDVQVTFDGVPLVLHDDKLDRVTPCSGPVSALSANDIRLQCPINVLGSPRSSLGGRASVETHQIPTLAEVLAIARKYGNSVNIELKPFDESGDASRTVALTIVNSGVPLSSVIIQSFHPVSLQSAASMMPGVRTSMLTLARDNPSSIELALSVGAHYVSPRWPVDVAYVQAAHASGLLVAPWTLNDYASVQAARDVGVDAIISDDPVMAYWALRR
jgi:glycerophosphoryl diester phosphodiesterase